MSVSHKWSLLAGVGVLLAALLLWAMALGSGNDDGPLSDPRAAQEVPLDVPAEQAPGADESHPAYPGDWHAGQQQPVATASQRPAQSQTVPPAGSQVDDAAHADQERDSHSSQAVPGDDTEAAGESVIAAADPVAAPADPAPAGPGLLGMDQAKGQVFPAPDLPALAQGLGPQQRRIFERIHGEFPAVDLTDGHEYHGMLGDKRQTFGLELTDETVGAYRQWMQDADEVHRQLVVLHAAALGLSTGGINEEGRYYSLIGFQEGRPIYSLTTNVGAAHSTGVDLVRWNHDFDPALGGTVDGTGLYVNINDHGTIYEHDEFQLPDGGSRIMVTAVFDNGDRNHMTHVAGTVSAWGYDSRLLGMAPRSWIRSLIQQNTGHVSTYGMRYPGERHVDVNPHTGELQMKSVGGNTSLGSTDSNLRYTTISHNFDSVLRDFPYYIHFYAAGNNGSSFGTISNDRQLSKNTLTIGAAANVSRDDDGNYVSGGGIASFSSRGPTYDGRIKPDFTANGQGLRSTRGTSSSGSSSGTSMASPNAAGSTLVLIDYVQQRFPDHFFRSSTYKSLLMNTANDLGNAG